MLHRARRCCFEEVPLVAAFRGASCGVSITADMIGCLQVAWPAWIGAVLDADPSSLLRLFLTDESTRISCNADLWRYCTLHALHALDVKL